MKSSLLVILCFICMYGNAQQVLEKLFVCWFVCFFVFVFSNFLRASIQIIKYILPLFHYKTLYIPYITLYIIPISTSIKSFSPSFLFDHPSTLPSTLLNFFFYKAFNSTGNVEIIAIDYPGHQSSMHVYHFYTAGSNSSYGKNIDDI